MLLCSTTPRLRPQNGCDTTNCPTSTACISNTAIRRRSSLACAAAAAAAAAVGIDLGTTNSAVAILRKGDTYPTIIKNDFGSFTVPSVVTYSSDGSSIVGQQAKQQSACNPLNTYYSVKRLIGRKLDEVQNLELVYGLAADKQGGVQLLCPARGAPVTPQEVSADVLRHLLQLAAQALDGAPPQQVVITVPTYFDARQRAATLQAAQLAGIQQVSLIQEPVAAAMAFGFGKPYDAELLLVFDLGGGTFDLSLVDSFEGIMEVLGTDGDAQLGGDDFDAALAAWLQQQLASSSSSSSNSSELQGQLQQLPPDVLARLLEAAEAAKCRLTEEQVTVIHLDAPTAAAAAAAACCSSTQQQQQQQQEQVQQQGVSVELSRQRMHAATAQLRQRLWTPLQALADGCKLAYECEPGQVEQQLANHTACQTQQQSDSSSSSSSSNGSSDPYAPKPRKLTAVLLV
ncbi:Hsp70 protein-domain-containing protein [Scenedesmus sp. NREL 46B-D3]|nr:Hsp70 protein-domain-containing protein [Scenedesmus sp. NREL 46B-D3]